MKPSYPPELKKFVDLKTNHTVIQWTNSPAKDQHFYFTNYSITQDDRWLVFISERDGNIVFTSDREGTCNVYEVIL